MESWLARTPIVATDSQGPGEAIDDRRTGLITPVDEAEPLAAAINEVLGDRSLREDLVAAATVEYQTHYSAAVITRRYIDLFNELLGA